MLVILSGAYIEKELSSEFGFIPPAFLPLGNRRLYEYQVALSSGEEKVYMSIPSDYEISESDSVKISKLGIDILTVDVEKSLGESVRYVLSQLPLSNEESVGIIFGDTLFLKLPKDENVITLSSISPGYDWTLYDKGQVEWVHEKGREDYLDNSEVVSGYFNISCPKILAALLVASDGDFFEGLRHYKEDVGLTSVFEDTWLDFGHVTTYYNSKREFTTQRCFNNLKITTQYVEKSGSQYNKLKAEATWFESLPANIRLFTPQYLGSCDESTEFSYKIEYLYNLALNEVFVFSEISILLWREIFKSCFEFLNSARSHQGPSCEASLKRFVQSKSESRIKSYPENLNSFIDNEWRINGSEYVSFESMFDDTMSVISEGEGDKSTLIHGDFCFSNILYDFRSKRIKVIDPRGITENNEISQFGNIKYDYAKISHSIIGLYDWILAEKYDLNINYERSEIDFNIYIDKRITAIQQEFLRQLEENTNIGKKELYALQVHLFISMIPLHSDSPERQLALLANSYRIYILFLEIK